MSGATKRAPCGHQGEVVIGNYVKCLSGCDEAIPGPIARETTLKICEHKGQYYYNGTLRCTFCDALLLVKKAPRR